jgi:hypothetical protein
MNEQHVDDLITDCNEYSQQLDEFMSIANPELLGLVGDEPFRLRTSWR